MKVIVGDETGLIKVIQVEKRHEDEDEEGGAIPGRVVRTLGAQSRENVVEALCFSGTTEADKESSVAVACRGGTVVEYSLEGTGASPPVERVTSLKSRVCGMEFVTSNSQSQSSSLILGKIDGEVEIHAWTR